MKKNIIFLALIFSFNLFCQEMKFGVRVNEENFQSLNQILDTISPQSSAPLFLTISLDDGWEGRDLDTLSQIVSNAKERNLLVNIVVPIPKLQEEETLLKLIGLSEQFKDKIFSYELLFTKDSFGEETINNPDKLAYILKRVSLALRGESLAKIYIGSIDDETMNILEPLYEREFIAYIDGYSTNDVDNSGDTSSFVKDFVEKNHLGAPLRLHLKKVRTSLGAETNTMLSLSKGAKEVDIEIEDLENGLKDLIYLRKAIPESMMSGYDVYGVQVKEGDKTRNDIVLLPFLDSEQMVQGLYLAPAVAKSSPGNITIHFATADITNPVSYPMPTGEKRNLGLVADQKKGVADIQVLWDGKPQLILFERLKTGTVGSGEKITVSGEYKIPVEYIIARHQAVEQAQSLLLKNYTADAEVNYHFKIPGSTSSVDVTFINQFLFDQKSGARWVQKEVLLNGVVWHGKRIPELPIIEPEKINTLPLVLTLTRAYTYRLLKEEEFQGRNCYVIEFFPSPGQNIQDVSGRVWIDKETYEKKQIRIIQKKMTPPQVSNEEYDRYSSFEFNGKKFTILSGIKAQQIFTVIGQTITAEKEVYFTNLKLNRDDFDSVLEEALKSDSPILQDTEKGFKYLHKNKDGTRTIKMEEKTGHLAAVGGAYYDESLDTPMPFAGIDYFDYNYKKKKIQVNLLVAGPVDSISISKSDILPKFDFSLSGLFFLFSFKDRYYQNGIEQEGQELKTMTQNIYTSLGYRVTQFSNLKLSLDGKYLNFKTTDKTNDNFKKPKSHFDWGYGLSYEYSRRGWQFAGEYEGHKRSSWEDWGYGYSEEIIDKDKDYLLWDVSFGKTFYLPKFQKIGVSLAYLDGKDLDRFSKYRFTYMGSKSLSGFTGSGIRFDKGYVARTLYAFDIAKVVRFSASLDYGKIKQNKDDENWQNHTGLGVSGTISGPWGTVCSLDVGWAIRSDIPSVKNDTTVALMIFKIWGK